MIRKFRAGLALQPIATALFANSPFTEGKPNGFLSMRSHIWTDTDNNRTGMIPFVFDDSFSFEQYVEYALNLSMGCMADYHRFGWLLFLALRVHVFSRFKDLVTSTNGLVSIL